MIFAALWLVFGSTQSFRFQLFYVLFIPIVWIAVRFGLEGVTSGLVLTQIGLIGAIQLSGQTRGGRRVLSGADGRARGDRPCGRRAGEGAAAHAASASTAQEALNRASRLGTMGEFAAAVAHEINQPLTAIANYTRLAKRAAESTPPDTTAASKPLPGPSSRSTAPPTWSGACATSSSSAAAKSVSRRSQR